MTPATSWWALPVPLLPHQLSFPRPACLARLALILAASFGAAAPAARAADVELRTAYASGLAKVDQIAGFGISGPAGQNPFCTAEPKNLFWGTQAFNPAAPLNANGSRYPGDPLYIAPNEPSSADLVPVLTAGSHSDFCVGFTLTPNADPAIVRTATKANGFRMETSPPVPDVAATRVASDAGAPVDGDDMQRIVIDLPAGYLGALAGIPTCNAETDFGRGNWAPVVCPAGSQLGDAFVRINNFIRGALRIHLPLGGSPIYNLTHGPDEVGLLGMVVRPVVGIAPVKLTIRLTFTPDGSGRIRAIVDDAPRTSYDVSDIGAAGSTWRDGSGEVLEPGDPRIGALQPDARPYPLYIESVGIRTWGSRAEHPSMPADFGELGTECGVDTSARVQVTTVRGDQSTLASPPTRLTGCEQLEFRPNINVTTTERQPGAPTGVTLTVGLGQNTAGRGTALLRDAAIRLPKGLELGAQVASIPGGLRLCSAAQFAVSDPATPATCKDGAAVGTVTITSPLIDQPFVGTIYLGEQRAIGELPNLYLDAAPEGATADDAPRIKLVGIVTADPATGQITAAFANNPQLRFSSIVLDFPPGPYAFFTTPERCGTFTGTSTLTPWSGQAPVEAAAAFTIDQGCELPGNPTVDVTTSSTSAGARSQTRVTLVRPDRGAWLTHLNYALPTGLLADLNIPDECPPTLAERGTCPQSSRLGTVTALAGAGSQPWNLAGAIYLTARREGDVAGAVIVVRATVGDLDLGNVIVPGTIQLRPTDAGLTFDSDIPVRFRGVALQLRRIVVDLDRSNLMINPTACGPLPVRSTIDTTSGTSQLTTELRFTGCGELPFSPTMAALVTGDNRPGGHPGMYVRVQNADSNAALRTAAVTLPDGVAIDLQNVANPCARADFDALRCPAAARVGSVTARVAITSELITGDIFMLRIAGKRLPGLGLNFTGRFAQRVIATVDLDAQQRIVTSFPEIPDLPLRELVVQVDSTPRSPLKLPQTACANGTRWSGVFVAQGGQRAEAQTGLQCAAKVEVKLGERRGMSLRLFDFGGRKLTSLKLTLPPGWRILRRTAQRRRDQMWVRMTGGTGRISLSDRSMLATSRTKSVTTIRMKLGGDVVVAPARTARRVRVRARLVFTDGTVQVQRPALTVGP